MVLNTRVAVTHEAIDERLCQARLADPRLPGDVDDAPVARLGLGPATHQQFKLLFATEKRRTRIAQRFKSAPDRALAQSLRGSSKLAAMLQIGSARVDAFEQLSDEPPGRRRHDDRAWFSESDKAVGE